MKDGLRFVDCDMHIMEPIDLFDNYLDPAFKDRVTSSQRRVDGGSTGMRGRPLWFFDGAPLSNDGNISQYNRTRGPLVSGRANKNVMFAVERGYDAEAQVMGMEMEGIDIAVLFPTVGLSFLGRDNMDPQFSAAICRAYNDFIADWCKADPTRLKGVAIAPYLDPTEAARELDRAVSRLGLVGLMFPTFIPGRNVADSFFWPIYEEAERLGVPVGMHASGSETGDPYRFNNFLGVHTWTHAPEQMISVISCVYGGLFEKFQRLRIGFMESGAGWVPFFMEHMDGEFEKRPWDAPLCKAKPSEYMTCGRAYFSCEPEEKTIPYVIGWVGEDNILYASDYPHWDSEWPHTVDELMRRDDLNARVKAKILGQNALRFYDLKAPVSR